MGDFDPAHEAFASIQNRHDLKVFIKIITPTDQPVRGNAYLAHGFSDVHDTGHMRALTSACVRAGYRVIVWDATHTWGHRSDGETREATFYYHHADLEDVLDWSRTQPWYEQRFVLIGFSLGAMMAGVYAAAHPAQVLALGMVSPLVSGSLLRRRVPWPLRTWWRRRGTIRRRVLGMGLPEWEFMRSGWSYDLLAEARRLRMPVLIVGAGRDRLIPPRYVRKLYAAVSHDRKRLVIVPRALHAFDRPWEMERLEGDVREWLKERPNKNLPKNP
jgi:pimeloyl-ACP methyl ester carboxylesterase